VLDSQYFGVPQRRRRVFLVGGPTDAGVAEVLALTEGGGGDLAARGEAGADLAYALAASVRGTGDGHGNAWNSTYVTGPLGGGNDGIGWRTEDDPNLVVMGFSENQRAELRLTDYSRQMDGSEDGTGRGTPLIAVAFQNTGHGWWNQTDRAQAIRTAEHGSGAHEANIVTHALTAPTGRGTVTEDGTGRGTPIITDGRGGVGLIRRLTPL
jgi:DNA (cytosine-5)-methyltransferase 1